MKQNGDDLAADLESTVDKGDFLDFDKRGNPKKSSLPARVALRFKEASLQAWQGMENGRLVILVAGNPAEAAKMAKLRPSDLPFRFQKIPLPSDVYQKGIYRQTGQGWVISK